MVSIKCDSLNLIAVADLESAFIPAHITVEFAHKDATRFPMR